MARIENNHQSNEQLKKLMKIKMCKVLKRNGLDIKSIEVIHLYNELAMNALELLDEIAHLTSTTKPSKSKEKE